MSAVIPKNRRHRSKLRKTLRRSHQEAVASSTMTATSDNFLNAFAVYLHASAAQMGLLTALPQIFGAFWQLVSAWMGHHWRRKTLVVVAALMQVVVVAGMAVLAFRVGSRGEVAEFDVWCLIALAIGYFTCLNIIQPHWRAWMGGLVPSRRRGIFFAQRSRLTMISSLLVFVLGGALLSYSAGFDLTWLGFALLFSIAGLGRLASSFLLRSMHDPGVENPATKEELWDSWRRVRESLKDPTFRHYTFFVAGMQGVVAISAPFFAVYMLRELNFTYWQFSLNSIASVAVQFLMLNSWGRFADRFGNRSVMIICSCIIPIVPLLWLFSVNHYYLLLVQAISGFAWSGFTLCAANYLYDIRPHHTNFAFYAAVQSATSALAVFFGALLGGFIGSHAIDIWRYFLPNTQWGNALFVVFIATTVLRIAVAVYYLPRLHEPHLRHRPAVLEVILRVSRLNAISGVAFDWMSVTKKNRKKPTKKDSDY